MNVVNAMKTAAFSAAVTTALNYLEKDPETNIPKILELIDRAAPDGWYEGQRAAFRKAIAEKSNWYQLILKAYELDAGVRKTFFQNFIINASLKGGAIQEELKEREGCNIPWAILLDPTSACNLHCTGCWAAEYGNRLNLTLETIDSIIQQGKRLGTYMYIYTGGEPMVRKADLIKICEMHPDCEFLSFTNGTLIDAAFCKEMLRVIAAYWYAQKTGNTVYDDTCLYQHADHPYALANMDRRFTRAVDGAPGILECKSCTYRDQFEEVCNLIVEAASFQGAAFFYKKFWWMQ